MAKPGIDELIVHRPAIKAFITRLVDDPALADDLTQETYIRAARSCGDLRDETMARSWLHAIALNLVRDTFRARRRAPTCTSDQGALERVRDDSDGQEESVLKDEMSACIARYLGTLQSPQYDVQAAQLNLSVANSRVILHRGRAVLRKILEENCILSLGKDAIPCEPVK